MVADATIREQGYVYFVSESRELLRTIEEELFQLREDPDPKRIHALMRATHTLKGASANVGLETIQTIAHHMEDIFRTLFDPEAVVDVELEALLFEAYECLRLALTSQIEGRKVEDPKDENNTVDREEEVLATAVDVFAKIQERLGDCFERDVPIPSSAELGFDIVQSIFESGVQERIGDLERALQAEDGAAVVDIISTQGEIFVGLGESLGLPGFSTIAEAMQVALREYSDRPLDVGAAALVDLKAAHQMVLGGDREVGGEVLAMAPFVVGGYGGASDAIAWGETDDEGGLFDEGDWDEGNILDLTGEWESEPEDGGLEPSEFVEPSAFTEPLEMTGSPEPSEPLVSMASAAAAPVASSAAETTAMVSPSAPAADNADALGPIKVTASYKPARQSTSPQSGKLIRVELERLQELQHLVGELLIQQNRQSLQNEQLQSALNGFRGRLQQHQRLLGQLRDRTRALGITHDALGAQGRQLGDRERGHDHHTLGALGAFEEQSLGELVDATVAEADNLDDTVEVVERYRQQTTETTDKQRRLLGSVRDSLMDARMQPVSAVFQRFPQLVKQLVARHHKPVELRLLGERVAIDKIAIEELYDPLLHLVRNAFDHGIEPVEVRRAAGKPETGIIQLQAVQQGNQVLIIVSDDGGGIDPEKIRRKAHERQWTDPVTLDRLQPSELFDLLFEPSFSTTDQVSDLSGRGVGLDVVKSQMMALKGSVSVQSVLGRGTAFILRVPLSLMTARLLVCHADRAVYALLSDSISQILIPQPEQTHMLGGQRVLRWRQGDGPEVTLPVRKLSDLVRYGAVRPGTLLPDIPALTPVLHNRLAPLMLLRGEEGLVAIEVDGVVGEQELVLRQLSETIASPDYIYGCTILGDGRMALVLDGTALLERSDVAPAAVMVNHGGQTALFDVPESEPGPDPAIAPGVDGVDDEPSLIGFTVPQTSSPAASLPLVQSSEPAIAPQSPPAPTAPISQPAETTTLLVVEDSETERNILALTLQKAGYTVLQAADGQVALEQLRQNPQVKLVISDLEMPRMGGLEFLSTRRQDSAIAKIPVMMLTSCSGKQYQQIAMGLGAADYMTKPHLTQELLDTINRLITAA